MSWHDVIAMLDGRTYLKRMLYNMSGTAAAWDTFNDPTSMIAAAVDGKYWKRQGIWYPASTFPMGDSVNVGVAEHLRLLDLKPPEMEWGGVYYSQSGIVAHEVYKLTRPGKPYERHGETLKVMVILGPPCREKNVANGNRWAGWPMPAKDTRGISDDRWVDTPDYIYDFVNLGDIYGEVMDDDVGEDMTMIFRIVQDPKNFFVGKDSAVEQISELMVSPLREFPAAIMAIYNGLKFVVGQPWPTYPHTSYNVQPAIDLLNQIGEKEPILL